jgi:DNA polymerase-1
MQYFTYAQQPDYPLVFLVPIIRKDEIQKEYLDPFGIPTDDVMVLGLHYAQDKKKTPVAEMKAFIDSELVPTLEEQGAKYLVVADAEYFKVLAKVPKVDVNLGYVLDCAYGPPGQWKVVYVPNYRAVFYDPEKIRAKIRQGLEALVSHAGGRYSAPGNGIIQFEAYPKTHDEIADWLDRLIAMDCDLTIDIEAFDLKHHKAGIGTISFAWSKTEGISFPVDYQEIEGATEAPFGRQALNEPVRKLLRKFFARHAKRAIYHNIAYDVSVLTYQLYMDDILDTKGLLRGMNILLRNWDDTKLITYLATNSCAGNKLSLKDQAQAYSGNYAETDIKDITRIPLDSLLKYNLVDSVSTWFVHDKQWPVMVADEQEEIYQTLFKPATVDIIQMQLTGLPVSMKRVAAVKAIMEADQDKALATIRQSRLVQKFTYRLQERWVEKKNQELKKKRVTLADVPDVIVFNPNSGPQLQDLLFTMLGLPVLGLTDSKQPSTDGDTLEALVNHTQDPEIKAFLLAMQDYNAVNKILTSFIPAMENAALGPDGWHYLFGNFNLGGTLSGRLSSSDPNLQNLPANSKYAKLIKSCIQAAPGWLFCGLDFASLEDRISALTTKDPQKLKVYLDGFDGHCLRAYAYFGEQMPDIDPDSVESINSIQTRYKQLRQDSKTPTFALTYAGTWKTLVTNSGFSEAVARKIESRYHDLYQVSDAWVKAKLDAASRTGYVTVAFGLKVRTPLLKQVIRGTSKTPYEAEAEGRSAGNALGQSWCLLNSRASAEFMGKVRKHDKHRLEIRPCAHIHDAQYMIVKDDIDTLLYVNEHLVKAVQWQDHPEIAHPEVKLGGELSIFYPDWAHEIGIPNGVTEEGLIAKVTKALQAE